MTSSSTIKKPHTLYLVHYDPSYFSVSDKKCIINEAEKIVNSEFFNPTVQLLTGSGDSVLPFAGTKITWWPTNTTFIQSALDEEYTLVGGYFSYCLKAAFSYLIESLSKPATIHFPLPAIFDARIEYENGEEWIFADSVSIKESMYGFGGKTTIRDIALNAFPSAKFVYVIKNVFLEEISKFDTSFIKVFFWDSTDQFLNSIKKGCVPEDL